MSEVQKVDTDSEQNCSKDDNDIDVVMELPKKPLLSFGINRILGERDVNRSRSPSPEISHENSESDVEQNDAELNGHRSTSSSPAFMTSASPSKYDMTFTSHAHSIYPLDVASSTLLPLAGCGLYRGSHGIVKVPAQRPHTMLHMFSPYSIPWMDFRRDRFGGKKIEHFWMMKHVLYVCVICCCCCY